LIRSQNVVDGWLDLSGVAKVSREQHASMSNSIVRPLDVLLNITGASIGRTCVVPNYIYEANVNQHVCIIRCGEQLVPQFLFHYLSSDCGQKQIDLCQAGGNRQGLNYQQIAGFHIPLPPLPEQKAIAAVLSTWDRGIRQLSDLIAAKLRFKQGLMQQLLTGKRRFPEFRDEWESVHLKDVATINARTLPSNCDHDYAFRYIDLSSVTTGSISLPESTIRFGDAPSRARRVVQDRDVLLATVRPNLKGFAQYRGDGKDVICSTGFAVISAKRPEDSDYLWHLTLSDQVSRQLESRIAGSNFPAVNASDVENLLIPFPRDDRERDRVSRLLTLIDNEVRFLRRQLDALKQQKKGLMQKLLTGQVRVKLPEGGA
jgi:type I restriction enzyme S subunit